MLSLPTPTRVGSPIIYLPFAIYGGASPDIPARGSGTAWLSDSYRGTVGAELPPGPEPPESSRSQLISYLFSNVQHIQTESHCLFVYPSFATGSIACSSMASLIALLGQIFVLSGEVLCPIYTFRTRKTFMYVFMQHKDLKIQKHHTDKKTHHHFFLADMILCGC